MIISFRLLPFLFAVWTCGVAHAVETTSPLRWYKGNTHTHTTMSDGDSSPSVVAEWYLNHGYDFLVITDHNVYNDVPPLQEQMNAMVRQNDRKPFLLIPGEEVSDKFQNGDKRLPLHVCALDTTGVTGAQGGTSVVDVVQRCVDAIRARGGLPSINHPNFVWALTAEDLLQIRGLKHFEVFNGHPHVNNFGGGGRMSCEQMWDAMLSTGRLIYGVAVDDAHHFKKFDRTSSNPGQGWVVVRAPELSAKGIIQAMEDGQFYSSTGVEVDDVQMDPNGRSLKVLIHSERDRLYRTEFIGKGGTVLKTDETTAPLYQLQPADSYVRAKVTSSAGEVAWTQPLFKK